jgi:hypothetical protein
MLKTLNIKIKWQAFHFLLVTDKLFLTTLQKYKKNQLLPLACMPATALMGYDFFKSLTLPKRNWLASHAAREQEKCPEKNEIAKDILIIC